MLRQTLLAPLVDIDLRQRRPAWDRVNDALPTDYHPEFRRLVTAAVDVGLLDLNAKHYRAPAHALLGGGCRDAPVAVADERTGALFMLLECYAGMVGPRPQDWPPEPSLAQRFYGLPPAWLTNAESGELQQALPLSYHAQAGAFLVAVFIDGVDFPVQTTESQLRDALRAGADHLLRALARQDRPQDGVPPL